eukprot:PhM_4_TR9518/c2_g1_i1/m.98159
MQKMNMHIKKGKKKKLNKFLYRFYYYVEPKISPSVHPNYAQQLAAAQLGTRVMQGVAQLILSHSSTKTTTAPSLATTSTPRTSRCIARTAGGGYQREGKQPIQQRTSDPAQPDGGFSKKFSENNT